MTLNEFTEYLGDLEMATIIYLLVIIAVMVILAPLVMAASNWLVNAIFGAIERAWEFVTRRFRESR